MWTPLLPGANSGTGDIQPVLQGSRGDAAGNHVQDEGHGAAARGSLRQADHTGQGRNLQLPNITFCWRFELLTYQDIADSLSVSTYQMVNINYICNL